MFQQSTAHQTAKVVPLSIRKSQITFEKLAIPTNGKIDLIDIKDILYLKSDSNYTEIHLTNGKVLTASSTLKKYEAKLDPNIFIRIHNSYVVQRSHIESFLPQENRLILHDSQKVPVSRSKKDNLMQYLKRMMVSLVFMIIGFQASAQLTTWEPGEPSDYFARFVVEGPTDANCDCTAGSQDRIVVYSDDISNPEFATFRNHQNGSFGATAAFAVGPFTSITRQAQVAVIGAFDNNIVSCETICGDNNSGAPLTITTDVLYNASNISHIWNDSGSVTLNWTVETDVPDPGYRLQLFVDFFTNDFVWIEEKTVTSYTFECRSEPFDISFVTFDGNGAQNSVVYNVPARPAGLGVISGEVNTQSCNGASGITITATLLNPEDLSNADCWPHVYTDTTSGSSGDYTLDSLYTGVGNEVAEYRVEASFPNREYRKEGASCVASADTFFIATLGSQGNQPFEANVNFVDITSYEIRGQVISEISGCGIENVTIREFTPNPNTLPVITESDGSFIFIADEGDKTYQLYAQYNLGSIPDSVISVFVGSEDVNGVDFIHTETDTLRGFVGAGCEEFIGRAEIEIRSGGGCLIKKVTTGLGGYYEMVLPSVPIEFEITNLFDLQDGLDYFVVLDSLNEVVAFDLDTTTTLNKIYRKPLTIEVLNMPTPPCPGFDHPVLNQDQRYPLTIRVWESVGVCPADTGFIVISNDIGTFSIQNTIQDTILISDGVALYNLVPGDPVLAAPYHKYISFNAQVDGVQATYSDTAVVSGSRVRTSTILTTPSDSLPLLILRDPPGDGSFSQFSQGNTTTFGQSYSHEIGGSAKVWARAKIEAGLILKKWGELGLAIETGGSYSTSTETEVSFTALQDIATSSSSSFIGTDGDLIMGAAINFKYGLADDRIFDINSCSMIVDTSLVFSPDTFESTFIHSTKFIKTSILPSLRVIASNPDTTEAARRKFRNKIKVWEQMLQLNEDLKEQALEEATANGTVQNYTLDAGANFSSSITGSSATTAAFEFTSVIDANVAFSVGMGVEDLFEAEAGVEVNIRSEWGKSTSISGAQETTTGFTFADGDAGDFLSFDYTIDSVYGTPVFGNVIGATSCPHEPMTQIIDAVTFTVSNPVYVAGPDEDFHEFDFTILNISEPTESTPRDFIMSLVPASNPNGAIITINGLSPTNVQFYNVQEGVPLNGTIRITRPTGSNYSFEGIQFDLIPACLSGGNPQPELGEAKSVIVSAFFQSDCSYVSLSAPGENWRVNQSNNNLIPVTMDDYDLGGTPINEIRLMYKSGSQDWQTSNVVVPGGNLVAPPQTYNWDVSDLPDGDYLIRWELDCGSITNTSLRKGGKMDRKLPEVFGVEKPIDDLYAPGKEVSVQFDEDLDATQMNDANVYLMAIPQQILYTAQLFVDADEIFILPDSSVSALYNQEFEVGIMDVIDLSGNVRPDTVKWQFVISEPDTDLDGNPDTKDFCPGGNDFIDSDLDGIPDDCDCLPNDRSNGQAITKASLHFDSSEYIKVANDPALVPTTSNEVTYETWINMADSSASVGFTSNIIASITGNLYLARQNDRLQLSTSSFAITDINANVGAWSHFAFVFKTDSLIVYQDGVSIYANPFTHQSTNGGNDLTIGGREDLLFGMSGQMDEFRVWDHARTQADLLYYMHQELAGNETGLALYFDFNDGIPNGDNKNINFIFDKSINELVGAPNGFSQIGLISNWVRDVPFNIEVKYSVCDSICTDTSAALNFTSVNASATGIEVPYSASNFPTASHSVTFEAWIKPEPITSGERTIYQQEGIAPPFTLVELLRLSYTSSGALKVYGTTGELLISNFILPFNEWTHVALIIDQTQLILYINGELDQSASFEYDPDLGPFRQLLSGQFSFLSYKGTMDEVRFWDGARTAQQIQQYFQKVLTGSEANLATYYPFDEGVPGGNNLSINQIEDLSGNGVNGNMFGFEKTGNMANWVISGPVNFQDKDRDGIPNYCDVCNAREILLLHNMGLQDNSVYRATREIILGENLTVPFAPTIELRAPKVVSRSNSYLEMPGGILTIIPEACGNN